MSESPENWQRFGEWMLGRRQLLGLSQEKAAELAGIHRQQWYRIENGASTKRSTVLSIAAVLQVTPEEAISIAYGVGEPTGPADSIEDALKNAMFFDGKGLSDEDLAKIRPLLEVVDREVERLKKEKEEK